MVKSKTHDESSDDDDGGGRKKLLLCFAAMFVVLSLMVLSAPAKEKEGASKHYQTMGLKLHASAAEVKKAYRFLPGFHRACPPPHAIAPDNWHFACIRTSTQTAKPASRSSRRLSEREPPHPRQLPSILTPALSLLPHAAMKHSPAPTPPKTAPCCPRSLSCARLLPQRQTEA